MWLWYGLARMEYDFGINHGMAGMDCNCCYGDKHKHVVCLKAVKKGLMECRQGHCDSHTTSVCMRDCHGVHNLHIENYI